MRARERKVGPDRGPLFEPDFGVMLGYPEVTKELGTLLQWCTPREARRVAARELFGRSQKIISY